MPHLWKPEYDKPPFLKKLRVIDHDFKITNRVYFYPTNNEKEFFQTHSAIAQGLKTPGPRVWFVAKWPFLGIKGFAWELSVFDAGCIFFNGEKWYANRSFILSYPSLAFIKRVSTIAPTMTFFKLHKTKQKIRSNLVA